VDTKALLNITGIALMFCIGARVCVRKADAREPAKAGPAAYSVALDSLDGLEIKAVSETGAEPVKVKADIGVYRGKRALHMLNDDSTLSSSGPSGGESLAIVKGSDFKDGTIEVELVGMPRQGSNSQSRGLWKSPFAFRAMSRSSRTSICDSPTDGPKTNFVATTPRSTVLFQIFRGPA